MAALRLALKDLAHPAAGGTPLLNRIDPPSAYHEHSATIFEIGSGNSQPVLRDWDIRYPVIIEGSRLIENEHLTVCCNWHP